MEEKNRYPAKSEIIVREGKVEIKNMQFSVKWKDGKYCALSQATKSLGFNYDSPDEAIISLRDSLRFFVVIHLRSGTLERALRQNGWFGKDGYWKKELNHSSMDMYDTFDFKVPESEDIEVVRGFPCLMEHKIMGDVSSGIYLVNHYPENEPPDFSVCLVLPSGEDVSNLGHTYFKEKLNMKEWFFLPRGTELTLIN